MNYIIIFITGVLTSLAALSQEPVVTLQSTVKGNQEQPKVLYIMPWQKADRVALKELPMQGIVSDVFSNIDRDELLRELRFKKQLSARGLEKNH